MKIKNFIRFIKSYQLKNNKFVSLVDCAYQKDQKAIAELGTIDDLRELLDLLGEMETFWMKSQNKPTSRKEQGKH